MLQKLEDGALPDILGYFADQEERYLSRINQTFKSVTKADESDVTAYLADQDADDAILGTLLADLLLGSAEAGFAEGSLQIDISLDFATVSPEVTDYLTDHGLQHATGINATTREAIRAQLIEGVQAGEGTDTLAARVKTVFAAARDYRATTIARTETAQAFEYANQRALRESGVVAEKEWLTARDERTCPICTPLNGVRVFLGQSFPGGLEPGFIHVSCRCTSIGIIGPNIQQGGL